MASADADIFMILLRPTRVPILGEAVSHLFQGQVLIESLKWNLHNDEERKNAARVNEAFSKEKNLVETQGSNRLRAIDEANDEFKKREKKRQAAYEKTLRSSGFSEAAWKTFTAESEEARNKLGRDVDEIVDKAAEAFKEKSKADKSKHKGDPEEEKRREEAYAEADRNPNFEITFTKRIDIASTQLLNSMKAGDIFPSGTLTIHKRSATVMDGTSLVFNIQKIRLLDYKLQVVVTDLMTEMMEEWTCEFGSLAYVYKNPPSHYSHGNVAQAVAKTMSQGTMRAFTMKNTGSPI